MIPADGCELGGRGPGDRAVSVPCQVAALRSVGAVVSMDGSLRE